MTSSPQHPDPLQPVLREAEAELTRRLQEACEAEAKGIANESAAEICFEGLDDAARRGLAGHPARWPELTEQELDVLLQRAVSVRERKPQPAESRVPRAD